MGRRAVAGALHAQDAAFADHRRGFAVFRRQPVVVEGIEHAVLGGRRAFRQAFGRRFAAGSGQPPPPQVLMDGGVADVGVAHPTLHAAGVGPPQLHQQGVRVPGRIQVDFEYPVFHFTEIPAAHSGGDLRHGVVNALEDGVEIRFQIVVVVGFDDQFMHRGVGQLGDMAQQLGQLQVEVEGVDFARLDHDEQGGKHAGERAGDAPAGGVGGLALGALHDLQQQDVKALEEGVFPEEGGGAGAQQRRVVAAEAEFGAAPFDAQQRDMFVTAGELGGRQQAETGAQPVQRNLPQAGVLVQGRAAGRGDIAAQVAVAAGGAAHALGRGQIDGQPLAVQVVAIRLVEFIQVQRRETVVIALGGEPGRQAVGQQGVYAPHPQYALAQFLFLNVQIP